jgi:Na+-translocating ferredoxin:NAD+ oxidoreductase RnfD subunit
MATLAPPAPRELALGRTRIAIVLPSRRDPRLKLSAVIVALQVLGQTVLGFKVSIAQILVTVAACALIDGAVIFARERVLAWPASGLLTGNSIAFILRASGTRHGDWWSLHGIHWFLAAAVIALASKHLIRPGGRHIFNPSNVGLVWCLLVIGPARVFPQFLWWGPVHAPVIAALVVIALGAVWILRAVRMVPMALAFLIPFALLIGAFAAGGQSFLATWHEGPVEGATYWSNICASPELLIFVFFMMSDPKTAPRAPAARIAFGIVTALVAGGLIVFQSTEYGVKVALLASLTVSCALVPLIERLATRAREERRRPRLRLPRGPAPARAPALLAVAIIAVAAVVDTSALAHDKDVTYLERGLTGTRNPQ